MPSALRVCIERMDVPGVGQITASFGVATFPGHAVRATFSSRRLTRSLCGQGRGTQLPPGAEDAGDMAADMEEADAGEDIELGAGRNLSAEAVAD